MDCRSMWYWRWNWWKFWKMVSRRMSLFFKCCGIEEKEKNRALKTWIKIKNKIKTCLINYREINILWCKTWLKTLGCNI
jgi:hypothetical protein